MSEEVVTHDAFCRNADPSWTNPAFCSCEELANVRTDERIRLTRDEGWFTDMAHEASMAVAKVRAVRYALDQLRQKVESAQEDAWIDFRSAVPGDVEAVTEARVRSESYRAVLEMIDEALG